MRDDRWTRLGASDPYFAVCTHPRFRRGNMTEAERTEFFVSGEKDVSETFHALERVAPGFRPRLAVDFGCGVGRVAIPIAARSEQVIGADISPTMLAEAVRNASARGVTNVRFIASSDLPAELRKAPADFVHSYIVFQHIPPREGLALASGLLQGLRAGGFGALHFVHKWRPGWIRRKVSELRRVIAPLNAALNVIQRRPLLEPSIPVFAYDESAIRDLLHRNACATLSVIPTDHGGFLGAMHVFRKS